VGRGEFSPLEIALTVEESRESSIGHVVTRLATPRCCGPGSCYWPHGRSANVEIAARCDTSPQVVHRWRKRFVEQRLNGLDDRPGTGRPRVFPPR
jgi:hypothetical protein